MANRRTVITLTPADNPKPQYASRAAAIQAAVPALATLITAALEKKRADAQQSTPELHPTPTSRSA